MKVKITLLSLLAYISIVAFGQIPEGAVIIAEMPEEYIIAHHKDNLWMYSVATQKSEVIMTNVVAAKKSGDGQIACITTYGYGRAIYSVEPSLMQINLLAKDKTAYFVRGTDKIQIIGYDGTKYEMGLANIPSIPIMSPSITNYNFSKKTYQTDCNIETLLPEKLSHNALTIVKKMLCESWEPLDLTPENLGTSLPHVIIKVLDSLVKAMTKYYTERDGLNSSNYIKIELVDESNSYYTFRYQSSYYHDTDIRSSEQTYYCTFDKLQDKPIDIIDRKNWLAFKPILQNYYTQKKIDLPQMSTLSVPKEGTISFLNGDTVYVMNHIDESPRTNCEFYKASFHYTDIYDYLTDEAKEVIRRR